MQSIPAEQTVRKPIVAANWKMNGSIDLCELFATKLDPTEDISVWIFPTALHVTSLVSLLRDKPVQTGVQNVYVGETGAFTGEISAQMAAACGASGALVGHSERRTLFEETDRAVAEKFVAVRQAGLTPILCVGESLSERENDAAEAVVKRQLDSIFASAGSTAFSNAIVAYEPVWAIGTGLTASPEQAQAMHVYIRSWIATRDHDSAARLPVLYGGSVKTSNATDLIQRADIDGFLVGGASLDIDDFGAICETARH